MIRWRRRRSSFYGCLDGLENGGLGRLGLHNLKDQIRWDLICYVNFFSLTAFPFSKTPYKFRSAHTPPHINKYNHNVPARKTLSQAIPENLNADWFNNNLIQPRTQESLLLLLTSIPRNAYNLARKP